MVGAGTLITCSWQYLPSAMTFVLITETSGQLDYQFDLEMGDNRGMGLLSDTVGWLGDETFYVFINKTEKRQMSTYTCLVGTGDDTIQSNAIEFTVNGKSIPVSFLLSAILKQYVDTIGHRNIERLE